MENNLDRKYLIIIALVIALLHITRAVQVPPHILEEPEEMISFREDESIDVKCNAGGTPQVEYKWTKNGVDFKFEGRPNVVLADDGTGAFTINPATLLDEGSYQCFATNEYGTAMSRVSHLKRLFLASFPPSPVPRVYQVNEGESLKVNCHNLKSYPAAEYNWLVATGTNDTQPKGVITDERIQIDEQGNLYFANVVADDQQGSKIYMCSAFNPDLQLTTRGSSSRIIVNPDSPTPSSARLEEASDASQTVLEGGEIKLKCIFSGFPTPNVTWERSGGALPFARTELHDSGTALLIKDIQKNDEGEYTCTGNSPGSNEVYTMSITVGAAPKFMSSMDQPYNMNKSAGDSATFVCKTQADPMAEVMWMKNGQPIDGNDNTSKIDISDDGQTLTISDLCLTCNDSNSDVMVIQCKATNEHGYAFGQGYVNIVEGFPPYYEWRLIFVIILGCVALLVAILLLVVCIYLKKFRAKDRKGGYSLTDTKDGYPSEIPVQQTQQQTY